MRNILVTLLFLPLIFGFTWNIEFPNKVEKNQLVNGLLIIYPTDFDETVSISCYIHGGKINFADKFNFNRKISAQEEIKLTIWALENNLKIECIDNNSNSKIIKEISVDPSSVGQPEGFPTILKSNEDNNIKLKVPGLDYSFEGNQVYVQYGDENIECKYGCTITPDITEIGPKTFNIYVISEGNTYLFQVQTLIIPGGLYLIAGVVLIIFIGIILILLKFGLLKIPI